MRGKVRGLFAALATTLVAGTAHAQALPSPGPAPGPIALGAIEARPYFGWAFAPSSATGGFVGADVEWRISPALAVQVDGAWYGPFNAGPGATPQYPLNESDLSVDFDLALYPLARRGADSIERFRGESREGDEAGAFEPYVVGGVGVIRDRPIAVVDPRDRAFDWNNYVDFDVGVGARVFILRTVALSLELRDLVYYRKVESPVLPSGQPTANGVTSNPSDPATWYDVNTRFTNDVQVRLGLGFLFGTRSK